MRMNKKTLILNKFLAISIYFLFIGNFNLFSFQFNSTAPKAVHEECVRVYRQGDYQRSINYYLRYLNMYPDDEQLLLYLAYSYENAGFSHKSERTYIEILKSNPTNAYAKKGLTLLYQRSIQAALSRNQSNNALDFIKKGEFYIPDFAYFYEKDAEVNMLLNNYTEALKLWKISWEKNPLDIEKRVQTETWKLTKIGDCYKRLGKEYVNEWEKYLFALQKKYPQNKDLLFLCADLLYYYNEAPAKRNEFRNKALKIYQNEVGERKPVVVYFPLRGKWIVTSGNFEYLLDTHSGYDGYCYDFMKVGGAGSKVANGGGGNSSFLSYGENIYAAYDGVVESTNDGVCDNVVGKAGSIVCNQIKIRHRINNDTYFSVYLHLKKGTLQVAPGDVVKAGDWIACVGNSGFSYAPHLHFGVYDKNKVSIAVQFKVGGYDTESENIKKFANLRKNDVVFN